ncbi:MAG TPA: hypothetical protein VEA19_01795 [Actinomycetota bacterium]|nr:hypothetical protein [Actinomycetota bacterium]
MSLPDRRDIHTTYLGNFAWATANAIAGELEERGIYWWAKNPGTLTRVFFAEFGVRLFVDREHLETARQIADELSEGGRPQPG